MALSRRVSLALGVLVEVNELVEVNSMDNGLGSYTSLTVEERHRLG